MISKTTTLASCILGGIVLLNVGHADDLQPAPGNATLPATYGSTDGYVYATDCPPQYQGHHGHLYPGVPRVAGTYAEGAGWVGYRGLQGAYHVGKTGWRMLEGDPGYNGHYKHQHHVARYGYGGAGGGDWGPKHKHFYSYHRPTDLRYPPSRMPAAVVQYPYYTTRGPTDFFMK